MKNLLGFIIYLIFFSDTIVSVIKVVLLRMNLSLFKCRGQCYDGAGTMAGCRNGVAAQLLADVPSAHLTHCHGHAFSLAVHDMIKGCGVLSDTLDTTMEICKFSPKREGILSSIKADIHMDTPGIKMLCPTHWTVQGESYERIKDNYEALMLEWDICLEERLDTDMRARIIGVKAQMESFQFFFGLNLGATLLIQTDNLSKTLQKTQLSSVEGQHFANLVIRAITSMRSDEMFDLYFLNVKNRLRIIVYLNLHCPGIAMSQKKLK